MCQLRFLSDYYWRAIVIWVLLPFVRHQVLCNKHTLPRYGDCTKLHTVLWIIWCFSQGLTILSIFSALKQASHSEQPLNCCCCACHQSNFLSFLWLQVTLLISPYFKLTSRVAMPINMYYSSVNVFKIIFLHNGKKNNDKCLVSMRAINYFETELSIKKKT